MFSFLLFGHDTVECAYYLAPGPHACLDFERLATLKETAKSAKSRHPTPLRLGTEEFLLAPHGTGSGYPLLIENEAFSIQFGEFNKPNFFVTFRSFALWQFGVAAMHQRVLRWAASLGYAPYRQEALSRVDFTFDYQLELDFDENSFVTQAAKDNKHRKNGRAQTFRFGEGPLVLRVYDKCAEIGEKSQKTWFLISGALKKASGASSGKSGRTGCVVSGFEPSKTCRTGKEICCRCSRLITRV